MNLTLEAVLGIWVLIIFTLPLLFFNENYKNKNLILLDYFYNKIGKNESLRNCLIKENCNLEYVKSYNCTSLVSGKKIIIPKEAISFYLFGKYNLYCPTLVIIDIQKAEKTLKK